MAIKTFTTGEVLTASDTNTYLANSGLVYITSKTWTATSSNQQIDNCFTSTYDNYRITFTGVGNQATPTVMYVQLVDGTTPDGTANYQSTENVIVFPGPTPSLYYSGSQSSISIGFIGDYTSVFSADLYSPQKTETTNLVSECCGFGTSNFRIGKVGGMKPNTTQYEGLLIARGTGTWAGTVTIYGYRKG